MWSFTKNMKKTNSWLTCSGVKTIKKYCFSAVNSTLEKSQLRANFKNKNLLHTLLQTLKSHDRKSGKRFIRFQRFTRRQQQRHELLDVLPDASKATILDDFGDSIYPHRILRENYKSWGSLLAVV